MDRSRKPGASSADHKNWFYRTQRSGKAAVVGPFSQKEIIEFYTSGVISGETMIMHRDSDWRPVRYYLPSGVPGKKSGSLKGHLVFGSALALFIIGAICYIPFLGTDEDVIRNDIVVKQESVSIPPPPSLPQEMPLQTLSREELIVSTNDARLSQGVLQLRENPLLNQVAEARLRDMLEKQYFDHVSPTGESFPGIATQVGYRYTQISENLAKGSFQNSRKVIEGWLNSPGHRKNMLSPDVDEIGMAVTRASIGDQEGWVAVQILGRQLSQSVEHRAPDARQTQALSCVPPDRGFAEQIERKKREVEDTTRSLAQMKDDLVREKSRIENTFLPPTQEEVNSFNERIQSYNASLNEAMASRDSLQEMARQYTEGMRRYQSCMQSKPSS